ncbi:hypothetical protein OAT67_09300, partial [Bacteriovoracaceae bacterium]|nr:hypothetical protein [Bacteriovoracaceae bacterium]
KLGNLNLVLNNIQRLQEYNSKRSTPFQLRFNFLILPENWKEVKSMLQFCAQNNAQPFIDFCYRPEENSLLTLTENERIEILFFYIDQLTWHEFVFCMRVINPLINSIKSSIDKAAVYDRIKALKNIG